MRIEKINIEKLLPLGNFRISFPSDPSLHELFTGKFPGIPPVIVNSRLEIISGYDSYDFMHINSISQTEVIIVDHERKESLFLGYNSRAVLKPLSIYEKLKFLINIIDCSDPAEIYERTQLGIRIDEKLLSILPELTGEPFRKLLIGNRISLKTAVRICTFNEPDRIALAGLFSTVSFSSSNELNVLDLTGDICFRDKADVAHVLRKINVDSLLQGKDPSSAILSELTRLRYPSFSDYEREWDEEIRKINIPVKHTIRHYPYFEKKGIELKLFLDSIEKIKEISEKLGD